MPLRTPPQGGNTSLKIPPVVYVRRGEKLLVFVFFNLAQFHHIFTLFAQVMVSKASVTNYGEHVKAGLWTLDCGLDRGLDSPTIISTSMRISRHEFAIEVSL